MLSTAVPASAATIDASFSAQNFSTLDPGTPASQITGNFSLNFDPISSSANLLSFTADIGGGTFGLADVGLAPDGLPSGWFIGSTVLGLGQVQGGTTLIPSFYLLFTIDPATSLLGVPASPAPFVYADASGGEFATFDVTISSEVSAPLPESGTWATMLLGFGAIGFAVRHQRRVALSKRA